MAEQHVGFIAEDVPAIIASNDLKGLSPKDVVAVIEVIKMECREYFAFHH